MANFSLTMECMWTRHDGSFIDFERNTNRDNEMEYDSKGEDNDDDVEEVEDEDD